jgi:N-acetylneuraminic acid mutarotase
MMMKTNLRLLILLEALLLSFKLEAQWIQVADFGGLERDDLVAFTCNERAFVGSGMNAGYQVNNDFYEFKADLNQWQSIPNLPGLPRQYAFSFSFTDVAIVYAGIDQAGNDLKDGYQYHPQNNSWTNVAAYPGNGSRGCASSTLNNSGFVGLGRSNGNIMHNDWWQYQSANDTWTQKTSFPGAARNLSTCFESNGMIYVLGGIGANDVALNDIWQYNPLQDVWQLLALALPSALGNTAHCKVKNTGVLIGGFNGQNVYSNEALQFDAFNESWINIPPIPINGTMKGARAFSLNNELYVTCGITADNTRLKSTWKYNLINTNHSLQIDAPPITIYPLPANERFTIFFAENKPNQYTSYAIYDLHGTLVKTDQIKEASKQISVDTNEITAGFYLIKIYKTIGVNCYKLVIKN